MRRRRTHYGPYTMHSCAELIRAPEPRGIWIVYERFILCKLSSDEEEEILVFPWKCLPHAEFNEFTYKCLGKAYFRD